MHDTHTSPPSLKVPSHVGPKRKCDKELKTNHVYIDGTGPSPHGHPVLLMAGRGVHDGRCHTKSVDDDSIVLNPVGSPALPLAARGRPQRTNETVSDATLLGDPLSLMGTEGIPRRADKNRTDHTKADIDRHRDQQFRGWPSAADGGTGSAT